MPTLIERLTGAFKQTRNLDEAIRYRARHYGPVRDMLRGLDTLDRQARRDLRERLTRRTLAWAAQLPGALPAERPLREWPFLDKRELREQPQRHTRRGWPQVPAATSGSTGIPLRLRRSLMNVAAEQAFLDDLLGVWNLDFRGARMARLRADNVKPPADRAPPYGQYREDGRKLLLSSNHLSPATAPWFHAELQRFRPDVLFTHPSSAEALARFLQQRELKLDIPLVLTSSEMLHPAGRLLLERVFNATVIDYYGMAERVAFAAGMAAESYRFNPGYGHVELMPVDGAEAPPGLRAYEIIGTGYWNEAMPLVRYRSGDRVVVPAHYGESELEDVCLGLLPVRSIQGRDKEHLISPDGEVVVGLTHASHGVRGLVRMQIVQDRPDHATVHVVADLRAGPFDEAALLRNLRAWAPASLHFDVSVVDEIERLPSGKTPFVIRRCATATAMPA